MDKIVICGEVVNSVVISRETEIKVAVTKGYSTQTTLLVNRVKSLAARVVAKVLDSVAVAYCKVCVCSPVAALPLL